MTNHRIEVTLTEDDYFAFNCFMQFRLKANLDVFRRNQRITLILLLFMLVLHLLVYRDKLWTGGSVVSFGISSIIFAIYYRFASKSSALKRLRDQLRKILRELQGDLFDKPETTELRDEGVFNQNNLGQSIFPYTSLTEIAEDGGRVYVFIGKDRALILPRDRIPAATLDAFLDELKKRMAARADQKGDTP